MGLFDGVVSGAATGGSVGGPWGALIGAGIGLFGSLFGAHEQSDAANQAAQTQAAAAKYAADLQAQQAAATLSFTKGQAENAYQNSEAARSGNYGQWAAAQRRLGTLGEMLHLGPREIPSYVPGVDPGFNTSSDPTLPIRPAGVPAPTYPGGNPATEGFQAPNGPTPGAAAAGSTLPSSAALSDPKAWMSLVANPSQLSSWVKSVAPTMAPGLVNYYVGKIQGQPGANPTEQAGSANYWAKKIGSDPTLGGGGGASSRPPVGTIGSYLSNTQTPYLAPTVTPALSIPNPYAPRPLGAYLS